MATERVVDISHALAADVWGGPPDAEAFKRDLAHGREIPGGPVDGYRAFVTEGIPDDAVVAGPENDPIRRAWKYRVISNQWPDDGKTWFTPVATWQKDADSERGGA